MRKYYLLGVLGGMVVGAASLVISWAYAGAGHGTYSAAKILFPYTMYLATAILGSITTPLMVLALLEFPVYGLAAGVAASHVRLRLILPTLVLLLHAGMVALCFSVNNPNFT